MHSSLVCGELKLQPYSPEIAEAEISTIRFG